MATSKDGDSVAGPATPTGATISLDHEAMERIREGERITRASLKAQPLVDFTPLRHVFGPKAIAIVNGVRVEVPADGKAHKVPEQIAELMSTRQNAALKQEADALARAGR